jgi:hypothetical protein
MFYTDGDLKGYKNSPFLGPYSQRLSVIFSEVGIKSSGLYQQIDALTVRIIAMPFIH